MVVERQGTGECALSTMAALAGRSLAEVRAVAQQEAARCGRAFYWNRVLVRVAREVGGEHLAALLGIRAGYEATTTSAVKRLSSRIRRLPATGRGVARFRFRGARIGHVCPWQDGLIYDPEAPEAPKTLAEWRAANPGYQLDYATVEIFQLVIERAR